MVNELLSPVYHPEAGPRAVNGEATEERRTGTLCELNWALANETGN